MGVRTGYGIRSGGPRRLTACRSRSDRDSEATAKAREPRTAGAGSGAAAARHHATSPGTKATARRSSDHNAASPHRSHQDATSAARTWTATAYGLSVREGMAGEGTPWTCADTMCMPCADTMCMPCATTACTPWPDIGMADTAGMEGMGWIGDRAGRGPCPPGCPMPARVASKPKCRAACVASIIAPIPGKDRSRPPSSHPATNTPAKAAPHTHSGGMSPMASPCPAAASSTHTAANTTARRLRTAADAPIARHPPTHGAYVRA
ncbi:hypothetical protein ABZ484_23255 [Streptomyces sp. NPDC006393]|uniref:hypothetical protein n=1 Tax=Streptomyces sp. NPDC006393 TaxID=3156763 RepID=UPI00340291C3